MIRLTVPRHHHSGLKTTNWVLFIPVAILLLIVSIAPSVDALVSSFNVGPDYSYSQEAPQIGLENYRMLFRDRAIIYSLNITALWAAVNSMFTCVVSLLLAQLMLQRSRSRKPSIIHPILMIPLGIPIYIAVPLWRAFIHGDASISWFFKLTGVTMNLITDPIAAFISVLIASVWLNVPMTTFVIFSHLKHVGNELLDAARLETKYDSEILRFISFPIIRTSVLTMLALNFIKSFKEFTLIHLMTNGGVPLVQGITERYIVGSTTTLSVFMYNLFGNAKYGITAAFSVFITSIVAVILIFWYISTITMNAKRIFGYKLIMVVLLASGVIFDTIFLRENLSLPRVLIISVLLLSFRYRYLFSYSLWAILVYRLLDVTMNGFLIGFSPLVPATLYILPYLYKSSHDTTVSSIHENHTRHLPARMSLKIRVITEFVYRFLVYFIAFVTFVFTFAIVYLLFRLSISDLNVCYFDTWLPSRFSFQAFSDLFLEEHILRYFANTAILAVGSALVIPVVVIPAAWFLSTARKENANGIVSSVHTLGALGGMHSLVPLFSVFLALGLLNTYSGLILVYVVHALPFSLVNMKNFFEGHSREMQEPAILEGATTLQYVRHILVPLSRPIIKTSMLMTFLGAWNGFNAPLLFLTEESMYPMSLKLYSYVGSIASGSPNWNLFAAASIINLVIITLVGGRKLSRDPT